MVTEEQAIVPESAFADYEEDLIRDGLPPDQARATRRALERIVDRFTLVFATKADLHEGLGSLRSELRSEIAELRAEVAELRAEVAELRDRLTRLEERVRILTWVVGLGALGMMGMMAAILARL